MSSVGEILSTKPPLRKSSAKLGAPSKFNPKLGAEICMRLAGGESLHSICEEDKFPTVVTVCRWLLAPEEDEPSQELEDFRNQYAKARRVQAELRVDEIMDIADDGRNDWMLRNDPENAGYVANSEHINRSRLRIDSRKWYASKMLPKIYGEKVQTEHSGNVTLSGLVEASLIDVTPTKGEK